MHPQILDNVRRRLFYHGTSRANAEAIAREGFRVRYYTDEEGDRCVTSGGALGDGIYMTANPGTAMYFGQVLLRVEARHDLRILDITVPSDHAVLARLEREFGRAILTAPPRLVLPSNKSLTLSEAAALFRHHYTAGNFWKKTTGGFLDRDLLPGSDRLHREMRALLLRHGFHGFGDYDEWSGIVLFAPDSIRVAERVLELTDRQADSDRFMDFDSGGFSDGASPHRTVASVKARLAEIFPPGSVSYWSLPMEAEVA